MAGYKLLPQLFTFCFGKKSAGITFSCLAVYLSWCACQQSLIWQCLLGRNTAQLCPVSTGGVRFSCIVWHWLETVVLWMNLMPYFPPILKLRPTSVIPRGCTMVRQCEACRRAPSVAVSTMILHHHEETDKLMTGTRKQVSFFYFQSRMCQFEVKKCVPVLIWQ